MIVRRDRGLAISRDLARGMRGEIRVSSAGAGQGSQFVLVLPQAPTAAENRTPTPTVEAPAIR